MNLTRLQDTRSINKSIIIYILTEKFDIEILKSFNHIKNIKYLNKFSNNVQNIHTEHYKTLLVEIKESLVGNKDLEKMDYQRISELEGDLK